LFVVAVVAMANTKIERMCIIANVCISCPEEKGKVKRHIIDYYKRTKTKYNKSRIRLS